MSAQDAIEYDLLVEWFPEGVARSFHIPDENGEPLCGAEDTEFEIDGPHTCKITPANKGRLCNDCDAGEMVAPVEERSVKSIYVVLDEGGNPMRAFEDEDDAEELVEKWRSPPVRIHASVEEIDLIEASQGTDLSDLGEAEMMDHP